PRVQFRLLPPAIPAGPILEREMSDSPSLPEREALEPPVPGARVLLHSCCAPCSGEVMEAMLESGIEYSIFFYNPNIHPRTEYEIRKRENIAFAEKHGIEFIDADYDKEEWFARARGMEHEPERGVRCTDRKSTRLNSSHVKI